MPANVGTAQGYLDIDISKFAAGLKEAAGMADSYGKNIETALGSKLQSVGGKMASAGKTLTKTVTAPILGAGAAAVKVTADFDEGMSKVQALSGATGDELDQLRDKAKEMGAKTKFSATESAEAFQYMALAGWDTSQMLNGIEGIMNLAAAAGEDLASVSDIVTDGLTAFGLEAKDSAHFADVLATTMASSNTDVAGLGEAFKYVGPVAGAFGYSIEDVSIALGSMANAGIKGSSMGTALRQSLVQLTSPSDTAAAYMDKFGVSLFDAEGNTKDLMTIMQDLRGTFGETAKQAAAGTDDLNALQAQVENNEEAWAEYAASLGLPADQQEKLTALTEIFGARSMPAMLAIIEASDESFDGLTEKVRGATKIFDTATGKTYDYQDALAEFGDELEKNPDRFETISSAAEMTEVMMNNLNGQLTIIKSSLEGFAISIGEILMPYIRQFATKLQDLLNYFNSLDEQQKKNIIKWALIAASIGPAIFAVGKLISGFGKLFALMGKLPGVASKVNGGFLALETGLGKVRNGFRFAQAGMASTAAESSVLGAALGSITAPIAAVIAVIGALVAAFVYLWNTNEEFRGTITGIWEDLKAKFESFAQGIVDRVNELGFNFEDFGQMVAAIWDTLANTIAPVFIGAFEAISAAIGAVLDVITGFVDVVIGLFTGDMEQVQKGGIEIFEGLKDGVLGVLSGLGDALFGVVSNIAGLFGVELPGSTEEFISAVQDMAGKVVDFVTSIPGRVASFVTEFPAKAAEAGQGFLDTISSFMEQLPEKLGYAFGFAVGSAIQFVTDMATQAQELGSQFISNVVQFFSQLPGKIASFIKSVPGAIAGGISNLINTGKTGASNFLNAVISFVSQLPGKVASFVSQVPGKVSSFFSQIPGAIRSAASAALSAAAQVGRDIVNGIVGGIQAIGSSIASALGGFVSGAIDGAKAALNINSPSRVTRDQIGKPMMEGVLVGVQSLGDKLTGVFVEPINSAIDYASETARSNADKLASGIEIAYKAIEKMQKKKLKTTFDGGQQITATMVSKMNADAKSVANAYANSFKGVNGTLNKTLKKYRASYDKHMAALTKKEKKLQKQLNKAQKNGNEKRVKSLKKSLKKVQTQQKKQDAKYLKQVLNAAKKQQAKLDKLSKQKATKDNKAQISQAKKELKQLKKSLSKANKTAFKAAEDKLKERKKEGTVSATYESQYWTKVAKTFKKGSSYYKKAMKKANAAKKKINEEYNANILKSAETTWDDYAKTHDATLSQEIAFWKKTIATMKKGTASYNEAVQKLAELQWEQYNQTVENAEDTWSKYEATHETTWRQEIEFWRNIVATCIAGTEEYNDAVQKLAELEFSAWDRWKEENDEIWSNWANTHDHTLDQELTFYKQMLAMVTDTSNHVYKEIAQHIAELEYEIYNELNDKAEETWSHYEATHETTLKQEIDFWRRHLATLRVGTNAYNDIAKKIEELQYDFNKQQQDLLSSYRKSVADTQETLKQGIQDVLRSYDEAIKDTTKSVASSLDLFTRFNTSTQHTSASLLRNLKSQTQALKEYNASMERLAARGASQNMLEELQSQGVDALADIRLLLKMSDEQWTEYLAEYERKMAEAQKTALRETDKSEYAKQIQDLLKEARESYSELTNGVNDELRELGSNVLQMTPTIGTNIVSGILSGYKSEYSNLQTYLNGSMYDLVYGAQSSLGIHSPSRVFANSVGKWIPLGISDGFADQMPAAAKAMRNELNKFSLEDEDFGVKKMAQNVGDGMARIIRLFKDVDGNMKYTIDSIAQSFDVFDMAALESIARANETESGGMFKLLSGKRTQSSDTSLTERLDASGNEQGGDTFIFNSPDPIDEVEAARQVRRVKRQLAEAI